MAYFMGYNKDSHKIDSLSKLESMDWCVQGVF